MLRPRDGSAKGRCGDFNGNALDDFASGGGDASVHERQQSVPLSGSAFACAGKEAALQVRRHNSGLGWAGLLALTSLCFSPRPWDVLRWKHLRTRKRTL